ncbi:DUF3299 domain-containing protein [Aquisalimonas sp.]|uniref:DUF3299 domain-containing protein n=1 Tax=Aquisalimonas sp. TaxID=1872621 RepID=UPI0025C4A224|nr:DUF3299 domain-containing protein [Aquisalimonas sp.]
MLRFSQALLITAVCLALAGCGSDEPSTDSLADTDAQADPQRPIAQGAADRNGNAIRIYMVGMDDFGEVAGLTTSREGYLDLTLALEDDGGKPIASETLDVSSLVGNELNKSQVTTDAKGKTDLRFRAILPGQDTLTVTGAGTSKQLSVYVSDEAYGHSLDPVEEHATELPQVQGAVSWDLLGGVETQGGRHGLLEPLFDDEIRDLDGRDVKLQGFMMPLDNSERQQHFLITRTPPSCFYCLPGGPESVVEVKAARAVAFTFEPVVLSGRMTLLEDSDMGLFYRLEDAQVERE